MKKNIVLFVCVLFVFLNIKSQNYYYVKHQGNNPLNMATGSVPNLQLDDAGVSDGGWTKVLDSASNPKLSKTIILPFIFQFDAVNKNAIKVGSTGFVTFDTTNTAVPSLVNGSIPNALLPDNSIAVWGLSGTGDNDVVLTKVFGSAPNRQYWIKFSSFSKAGDTTGSWNYWSIVLEETSNRIFNVGMFFNQANNEFVSPVLHIGVQKNSSMGVQVPSVQTQSYTANKNAISDNFYYEFIYGIQPTLDAALNEVNAAAMVKSGTAANVGVEIVNNGSVKIDSVFLNYSLNGGATVQQHVKPIVIKENRESMYLAVLNPAPVMGTAGAMQNIKIWISNPNGISEFVVNNDTQSVQILSVLGTPTMKKLLVEAGTGTWCGSCPMADYRLKQLQDKYKDSIVVAQYHSFDGMGGRGDSLNRYFFNTLPGMILDRTKNISETEFSKNIDSWQSGLLAARNVYTPLEVLVKNVNLDTTTRVFSFSVRVKFNDYCSGKLKIGAMAAENNVRGAGPGFNQIASFQLRNEVSSPFKGLASPIIGYYHQNVVWDLPGSIWGKQPSVVTNMYAPGDSFDEVFSYKYPALLGTATIANSPYEPNGTVFTTGKPMDMEAIGFAALVNADGTTREILNASNGFLWNLTLGTIKHQTKKLVVYPNPTKEKISVVVGDGKYTAVLYNLQGAQVFGSSPNALGGIVTLDFSKVGLRSGIYFLQLRAEDGNLFSASVNIE